MDSHPIIFRHESTPPLVVWTGLDSISWGYSLNTANFATYAGEVVQILSCFVDDLSLQGTLRTYSELESVYTYFLQYIHLATQSGGFNQIPMTLEVPHREWSFKIVPKEAPGYRLSREVVAPEWRLNAFVSDEGDVQSLKNLIIQEAELKLATHSTDPNFDENFGLEGKIKFIDKNPFSAPFTSKFEKADLASRTKEIGDWYQKLIPAYMKGDFGSITEGLGSGPAFGSTNAQLEVDNQKLDTTVQSKLNRSKP